MNVLDRFLSYAVIKTPSDEASSTVPSSACQFDLAKKLEKEMKALEMEDVILTDTCYLYGKLKATKGCESAPKIGFIAHMDTVAEFTENDINPIIHNNYDGGDLRLGSSDTVLSPKNFSDLSLLKGRTLITGDGTTILGADDKAGIAEIMAVIEEITAKGIPHGQISVGFTPDEEIGRGADAFDLTLFDADFAYTLDGDLEGGIEYENFNACDATFQIKGFNVHPGSSKDTMINASLVAMEINSLLPGMETPRGTEKHEGFYHLYEMSGDVAAATLRYKVRDHSAANFSSKKATLALIEKNLNEKWGEGCVRLTIRDEYQNMYEIIKEHMHLIETAKTAAKSLSIEPTIDPIRGGTDGAMLCFKGLPCPNLGTGGSAYHGPYEHITKEGMEIAAEMALEIIRLYAATDNHR